MATSAGRAEPLALQKALRRESIEDPEAIRQSISATYKELGCLLDDIPEAVILTDPLIHDCPIVGASRGTLELTQYDREFIIGRNCRIMLQGVPEDYIAKSVRRNLRDYCRMCLLRGLNAMADLPVIQANARKDGSFFMNFLSVGFVKVHDHPYVLGVQQLLAEGPVANLPRHRGKEVKETGHTVLRKMRQLLLGGSLAPLASLSDAPAGPGFRFFRDRLEGRSILLNECKTTMRREPEETAINSLVFGDAPVKRTACGLYFAVVVEDVVKTFAGLPVLGFTQKRPSDRENLYPVCNKCLGASRLIGACGEAFARDKTNNFEMGFVEPPQSEVETWYWESPGGPVSQLPKKTSPFSISKGDVLGCLYTVSGRIILYVNGERKLSFDLKRPLEPNVEYYAVVDACFTAYALTLLPAVAPIRPARKVNRQMVADALSAAVLECTFPVAVSDPLWYDSPLLAVNHAFEVLSGYPRDEILGKTCQFLGDGCCLHDADSEGLRRSRSTGQAFAGLLPNRKRSGEMFVNHMDQQGVAVAYDIETGRLMWCNVSIQVDVTSHWDLGLQARHETQRQQLIKLIGEHLKQRTRVGVRAQQDDLKKEEFDILMEPLWIDSSEGRSPKATMPADVAAAPVDANARDQAVAMKPEVGKSLDIGKAPLPPEAQSNLPKHRKQRMRKFLEAYNLRGGHVLENRELPSKESTRCTWRCTKLISAPAAFAASLVAGREKN